MNLKANRKVIGIKGTIIGAITSLLLAAGGIAALFYFGNKLLGDLPNCTEYDGTNKTKFKLKDAETNCNCTESCNENKTQNVCNTDDDCKLNSQCNRGRGCKPTEGAWDPKIPQVFNISLPLQLSEMHSRTHYNHLKMRQIIF